MARAGASFTRSAEFYVVFVFLVARTTRLLALDASNFRAAFPSQRTLFKCCLSLRTTELEAAGLYGVP
jgi:hypothetical protein